MKIFEEFILIEKNLYEKRNKNTYQNHGNYKIFYSNSEKKLGNGIFIHIVMFCALFKYDRKTTIVDQKR